MQYRPNPTGLSLNSRPNPNQFVPPAPAPAAAPAPFVPMDFAQWAAENNMSMRGRRYTGDRGSRSGMLPPINGKARRGYNDYLRDNGINPVPMGYPGRDSAGMQGLWRMGGGYNPGVGGVLASPSAAKPSLSLDSTAAAYANFLNGVE